MNAALPMAVELRQVFDEARDIAERVRQPVSTAHVLLALFTLPNHAQMLLADRRITEDNILAVIRRADEEPPQSVKELKDKAEGLAVSANSRESNCLHLLLAMTRVRGCLAHALLTRSGQDLTELRTQAMGYLTGRMPRRYANFKDQKDGPKPAVDRNPPSPPAPPSQLLPPTPLPAGLRVRPGSLPMRSETGAPSMMPQDRSRVLTQESELPSLAPMPPPPPTMPPDKGPHALALDKVVPLDKAAPATVKGGLDPKAFPLLTSLAKNLTQQARESHLDHVVGRMPELERMLDVLGKRRSNNPLLVGEPGVGKTALVEGLARRMVAQQGIPGSLKDTELLELDMGALVAGTALRGSFSERMLGLKEELRRSGGKVIVFMDEIHTVVGAGASGEGSLDAANELKSALARGEFPCIGATTPAEYAKHIEKDPALARRFVVINLTAPTVDEARAVLEGVAPVYAGHHGVTYDATALFACVQLSDRFILDRSLPGKAIDVLDLAGSRARRMGKTRVERADVAHVIAEVAAVPLDRLLEDDQVRLLHMEEFLADRIVGHRDVLRVLGESIRRAYAGFGGRRPMGSFLFLGPTGVGKTETVKALAEFLFGSKDALLRLDMSEYGESHAVSRLVGAPPGYVGHDDGGQLTDAVRRRPYTLILLDEVEKAHPDVLLTMLQVLDEGRLTDSKGRTVNFRNTVVVMTSNLGAERFDGGQNRAMGFSTGGEAGDADERAAAAVLEVARKAVPPELWGRIDERLVFKPLKRADVEAIARALLAESALRLKTDRNVVFVAGDDVVRFLMEHGGYNATLGARPMRQAIQKHVESLVADAILAGRFGDGDQIVVKVEDGALSARHGGAEGDTLPP